MCRKCLIVVFVSVILCQTIDATRDDVVNEYQPVLIEKAKNFTADYNILKTEYGLILNQIKNTTLSTIAMMNSQILTLKSTIATAKNISANNTKVLDCLKPQEAAAANLTTSGINATCWVGNDFPELQAALEAVEVLAKVPNATLSACTTLNPLSPSQDEQFKDCVADKIIDLDKQINIVTNNFEEAKSATIQSSVQCVANQSAILGDKISEINLYVTLCLSLK